MLTQLQELYQMAGLPQQPDIIVILTDQERYPAHWPSAFVDSLTSWKRLQACGLTFKRAYTSACMCTPSRGVMITSNYSNLTGLAMTPGELSYDDPRIPQLAALMQAQGYDTVWKGKWHLSTPCDVMQWSAFDVGNMETQYGFAGWNPPDAGTVTGFSTYDSWATAGSGVPGHVNPAHDMRYLNKYGIVDSKKPKEEQLKNVQAHGFGEGAFEFLEARALGRQRNDPAAMKPFLLFMSFVNPHDINFFPDGWQSFGYTEKDLEPLKDLIKMPPNAVDSLETKPTIQTVIRNIMNHGMPLIGQEKLTAGTGEKGIQPDPANTVDNYIRFYAYMTMYANNRVNEFMDHLDKLQLTDNALVIRTADHGEMGLSHGMREKVYNVYEETIHIPLVISNPRLFKKAVSTEALYAHVDFLPTLLGLAGTNGGPAAVLMKGKSLVPVIVDPSSQVQDTVLFCYDDESAMISDLEYLSHIRAIRHGHYTYAVYYSPNLPGQYQYELYDLKQDGSGSLQMTNLLAEPHRVTDGALRRLWSRLQVLLSQKMIEAGQTPFPPVAVAEGMTAAGA